MCTKIKDNLYTMFNVFKHYKLLLFIQLCIFGYIGWSIYYIITTNSSCNNSQLLSQVAELSSNLTACSNNTILLTNNLTACSNNTILLTNYLIAYHNYTLLLTNNLTECYNNTLSLTNEINYYKFTACNQTQITILYNYIGLLTNDVLNSTNILLNCNMTYIYTLYYYIDYLTNNIYGAQNIINRLQTNLTECYNHTDITI